MPQIYEFGTGNWNCSTCIMAGFYVKNAGESGIEAAVKEIKAVMATARDNIICTTNSGQDALIGEALRRCGFVAVLKAPGNHGGFQTFYAYNRRGGGQLAPQLDKGVPGWIVPVADRDAYQKPQKNVGETGFGVVDPKAGKLRDEIKKLKAQLKEAEAEDIDALKLENKELKAKLRAALKPPALRKLPLTPVKRSRFDKVTQARRGV